MVIKKTADVPPEMPGNLQQNLGNIIRMVRMELGMSLDDAAKFTGVSKAMLGQIERNTSNPTISTLWKISSGLKIPFSRLLNEEPGDYEIRDFNIKDPIIENNGKFILYNIFPFDPISGFDYFYIKALPGSRYESPTHPTVLKEKIKLH